MITREATVQPASPRQTAQVRFADGRTYQGPMRTTLVEFVDAAYPDAPCPIVAALVNDELMELTHPVSKDADVLPIDTSTNAGMRIYQRSLSFVLIVAVHELFPEVRLIVDHSVTLGGFFCQIVGREVFSLAELEDIQRRMREIVAADEPILRERIPVAAAKEMFASQGYDDKVHLLDYLEEDDIAVYRLRGVRDYFFGSMMPSTGKLRWFSLRYYPPGLILRMPRRQHPTTLPPHRDYPKLTAIFREYRLWLRILGIEDVGALNRVIESGQIGKTILVTEALHEKRISDIADSIVARSGQVRLILIAGPSASGKTTFARRLAIQLMVNGFKPFALGLDDYFVDRELTPRDKSGDYDFESLDAVDLPLFNDQLLAMMAGRAVRLPRFNFKTGKRERHEEVRLPQDELIIVEGIHGLNPDLLPGVPGESVYRIYVSALTQLNIDHHNRVPTTDTRLLRRIVRDARHRGYSARETIRRWESVRRGEERNIFPYQENADVMFNSALAYELAVLKPFAEPLLLRVPHGTMEYMEARRLLEFLQWVRPQGADIIPGNSLLREFVGGSILTDFQF